MVNQITKEIWELKSQLFTDYNRPIDTNSLAVGQNYKLLLVADSLMESGFTLSLHNWYGIILNCSLCLDEDTKQYNLIQPRIVNAHSKEDVIAINSLFYSFGYLELIADSINGKVMLID